MAPYWKRINCYKFVIQWSSSEIFHSLQFMGFMELFMVVHEQYELFLVHSHDYEPLVHDIFIFIFTGLRVSPYSYSWVHKIFMNLFMVLQFYIHGFIGFSKKYSGIHDTKFMTLPTQIHEFIFFFMNIIHTTYEHIHGNGSWLLIVPAKKLNNAREKIFGP